MSGTTANDVHILREGLHHCPAHPDRRPSLSVKRAADGRWLLHDFAGCDTDTILRAAGLTMRDLFPSDGARPARPPRRLHWRDAIEQPLIARERRLAARRARYRVVYEISDHIRGRRHAVRLLRWIASSWGDVDDAWGVFALAADDEREINVIEAEVDAVLSVIRR